MFHSSRWLWCLCASLLAGCGTLPKETCKPAADAEKGPKTLLKWEGGKKKEKGKDKEKDAKKDDAHGGNGDDERKPPEPEKEDTIKTDRPDFTEASSTVGRGRVQLEAGYTFIRDRTGGVNSLSHSFPEAIFRIGMFADWFELRVGQNFGSARMDSPDGTFSAGGAEDLYLGAKLGLTEQRDVLPEMALIIQANVPTGSRSFTAGRTLPGLNWLYGWDLIEECLTLGGSTQGNLAVDDDKHGYVEFAQSLTVGYEFTKKFGAYTEWFAFFPAGATAPAVTAQHYFDGGFTYKLTPNFQLDIRAGVGLSRSADDFFAGSGFAVRY